MRMSPDTVRSRTLTARRSPLVGAPSPVSGRQADLAAHASRSRDRRGCRTVGRRERHPTRCGSPPTRRSSGGSSRRRSTSRRRRRRPTPRPGCRRRPATRRGAHRRCRALMSPDVARNSAPSRTTSSRGVAGGERDVGADDVVGAHVTGRRAHAERPERAACDDVDRGALHADVGADRDVDRRAAPTGCGGWRGWRCCRRSG